MILFKKCHHCEGWFWRWNMIHNITIGLHQPFSLCTRCYGDYFNKSHSKDDNYYDELIEKRNKCIKKFDEMTGEPMEQIDYIIENGFDKFDKLWESAMNGTLIDDIEKEEKRKKLELINKAIEEVNRPKAYCYTDSNGVKVESDKPISIHHNAKRPKGYVVQETVYARGGRGNSKLLSWEFKREVVEEPIELERPKAPDYVIGKSDSNLISWDKVREFHKETTNRPMTFGEFFEHVEENGFIKGTLEVKHYGK